MSRINFIPDAYYRRQSRRREVTRAGLCLVVAGAAMGAWIVYGPHRELARLDQRLSVLDRAIDEAGHRAGEAAKLESAQQERLALAAHQRSIEAPVTMTSILAVITESMPPAIGLTSVSVVGDPADPAPVRLEESPDPDLAVQPATPTPIRISLTGLAPDGMAIARFVGFLDEHELFGTVKLDHSGPAETDELVAQQFVITAEIPTDRTYLVAQAKETAHAD